MKDLTNLRKIAEAVKQEPWVLAGGNEWISPIGITVDYDNGGVSPVEAEFIATFDPPTVLALIARLELAEAGVARVRELALESQAEVAQMNMPNIRTLSGEILRALDGDSDD